MKIVVAQINYTVGDISGNLRKIFTAYEKVKHDDALLVLSELALTGYYPQDLLLREAFLNTQNEALHRLILSTKGYPCGIVVGCVRNNNSGIGKPLFNSVVVIKNGKQVFEYNKHLLPTYNVFDEARHFEPGSRSSVFSIENRKVGILICEDAWFEENEGQYELDPVDMLENQSLDLVISVNASPSNLGKQEERLRVSQRIVKRACAPLVYANQIGGNDELVFDGGSFFLNKEGCIVATAKCFEEDTLSIDLDNQSPSNGNLNYLEDNQLLWQQTVLGIRDYVEKCGFSKVVIGSSGGIDSAVTLAICTKALGAQNVAAITMPSKFSSKGSVDDSEELCRNLGVQLLNAPINKAFDLAVKDFSDIHDEEPSRLTKENIQARIRGRKLMEYSNHFGSLVISTGNKSEMSVGYATLYGDMNGGVNPLGDLYKMEVYALAKYINQVTGEIVIPLDIINKAPSAELSEGQVDSDSLPDYPLLDAILKLYIEGDLLTNIERKKCTDLIEFSQSEGLANKIESMVDRAEFKRRQAPPIIRVQKRSFGMGRWLPVAAHYSPGKSS